MAQNSAYLWRRYQGIYFACLLLHAVTFHCVKMKGLRALRQESRTENLDFVRGVVLFVVGVAESFFPAAVVPQKSIEVRGGVMRGSQD